MKYWFMYKRGLWVIIFVLLVPFKCLADSQAAVKQHKLTLLKSSLISTAYFDASINEYKFHEDLRGRGGAITLHNDTVVLATTEGKFYKINLKDKTYFMEYLPSLNMGEDKIKLSKRITYQELLPRVHDIQFHKGTFYVSYDMYSEKEDCIFFVIYKMKVFDKAWTELYRTPPLDAPYYSMGNGGRMAVSDKKKRLYFTLGDYSLDRINNLPSDVAPQNLKLPWGKVSYIDLNSGKFHNFSLGHRNQQGLVILKNGTMIASEHGPQGGDELNVIEQGKNYGWPYRSFGTTYGSYGKYSDALKVPKSGIYQAPIFSFVPSISPTQLIQVNNFDVNWDGDILLGSLKAMSLFHIKIESDRVIYSEQISIGQRIRDLKQYKNTFVILTDNSTILEISKSNKQ